VPYYITDEAEDCDAWATIKDDGEIMGCHLTKDEAIDQMVALSIEEGIEPGGERSEKDGGLVTATRDDVQVRQLDFEVARDEDGLTLDGYGAVFDSWTEIADSHGLYRERISPGAFRRTLGQRMPVLQFDHGQHPLIGSIPLGRITSISEDAHGLRVRAKLSDNWLVEPVRDAIRDGAVTGMSFRFRVMNDDWTRGADGMDERTIREVALLEVGPVVFPAYSETSVSVRSIVAALVDDETRHEVARALLTNDPKSFAIIETDDDSAICHSSDDEPSTGGHGSTRTKAQRRAKAMLAGVI